MRSALFFGFVGVVFSASVAGAGELPPCSQAAIQVWLVANAQRQAQRHPPGIPLSLNCIVTQQSVLAALVDLQRQLGGRRVPPPETAIDRSDEPCWIKFPQRGDPRYGLPMEEGVDFGYCPPRVPVHLPTPRPTHTAPVPDWPQPFPSRTPEDDERDYWRRKLLDTLQDFRSEQLIDRNRRVADVRRERDRLNNQNQMNLSIQRDGYVAPPWMPTWQPRQPPVNLLAPPGSSKGNTGGCSMHPSAAC